MTEKRTGPAVKESRNDYRNSCFIVLVSVGEWLPHHFLTRAMQTEGGRKHIENGGEGGREVEVRCGRQLSSIWSADAINIDVDGNGKEEEEKKEKEYAD